MVCEESRSHRRGPHQASSRAWPVLCSKLRACVRLHGRLHTPCSFCAHTRGKRAHVASGRWYVRNELTAVIQFKKYRVMRQRYNEP